MSDVAILDYQLSNLHSVQAACENVGLSSEVTGRYDEIERASALILPGVGAFGEAISQLKKSGMDRCIKDFVSSGRPLIGICLGMQLLFEDSQEFGEHSGLGLIRGSVQRFDYHSIDGIRYPVPHVGWNAVTQERAPWESTFLGKNHNGDLMYFVHSYYVVPAEQDVVLASSEYGGRRFCSALQKENIFATQFHSEKSGDVGLKIYEQLRKKLLPQV